MDIYCCVSVVDMYCKLFVFDASETGSRLGKYDGVLFDVCGI